MLIIFWCTFRRRWRSLSSICSKRKNISVIGTFNNWDDQASKMKKDKRGIWECFVQGAKNQDSYKYRVWQAMVNW